MLDPDSTLLDPAVFVGNFVGSQQKTSACPRRGDYFRWFRGFNKTGKKKRVRKRVVWRWKPFFQEKDPIIHHDVFLLAEF